MIALRQRSDWSILNNNIFQYKVGQLFMIAKHSMEQSQKGEGVEVVENKPHEVNKYTIFCSGATL